MKIEYQDRIDDYLLKRMSDEERNSFEADLIDNAELKEQLAYTEVIQNATRSRNEKLTKMKEWQAGNGQHSSGRRLYWLTGIAAVIIAGFFVMRDISVVENQDEQGISLGMSEVSFRGGSSNEKEMYDLLNWKKYAEILELIEEKIQTLEADSMELVQDSTIDEEQRAYDMQIIKDKKDELIWLKINALIGMNENKAALELLDELRNTSERYRMSADSLYYSIRR